MRLSSSTSTAEYSKEELELLLHAENGVVTIVNILKENLNSPVSVVKPLTSCLLSAPAAKLVRASCCEVLCDVIGVHMKNTAIVEQSLMLLSTACNHTKGKAILCLEQLTEERPRLAVLVDVLHTYTHKRNIQVHISVVLGYVALCTGHVGHQVLLDHNIASHIVTCASANRDSPDLLSGYTYLLIALSDRENQCAALLKERQLLQCVVTILENHSNVSVIILNCALLFYNFAVTTEFATELENCNSIVAVSQAFEKWYFDSQLATICCKFLNAVLLQCPPPNTLKYLTTSLVCTVTDAMKKHKDSEMVLTPLFCLVGTLCLTKEGKNLVDNHGVLDTVFSKIQDESTSRSKLSPPLLISLGWVLASCCVCEGGRNVRSRVQNTSGENVSLALRMVVRASHCNDNRNLLGNWQKSICFKALTLFPPIPADVVAAEVREEETASGWDTSSSVEKAEPISSSSAGGGSPSTPSNDVNSNNKKQYPQYPTTPFNSSTSTAGGAATAAGGGGSTYVINTVNTNPYTANTPTSRGSSAQQTPNTLKHTEEQFGGEEEEGERRLRIINNMQQAYQAKMQLLLERERKLNKQEEAIVQQQGMQGISATTTTSTKLKELLHELECNETHSRMHDVLQPYYLSWGELVSLEAKARFLSSVQTLNGHFRLYASKHWELRRKQIETEALEALCKLKNEEESSWSTIVSLFATFWATQLHNVHKETENVKQRKLVVENRIKDMEHQEKRLKASFDVCSEADVLTKHASQPSMHMIPTVSPLAGLSKREQHILKLEKGLKIKEGLIAAREDMVSKREAAVEVTALNKRQQELTDWSEKMQEQRRDIREEQRKIKEKWEEVLASEKQLEPDKKYVERQLRKYGKALKNVVDRESMVTARETQVIQLFHGAIDNVHSQEAKRVQKRKTVAAEKKLYSVSLYPSYPDNKATKGVAAHTQHIPHNNTTVDSSKSSTANVSRSTKLSLMSDRSGLSFSLDRSKVLDDVFATMSPEAKVDHVLRMEKKSQLLQLKLEAALEKNQKVVHSQLAYTIQFEQDCRNNLMEAENIELSAIKVQLWEACALHGIMKVIDTQHPKLNTAIQTANQQHVDTQQQHQGNNAPKRGSIASSSSTSQSSEDTTHWNPDCEEDVVGILDISPWDTNTRFKLSVGNNLALHQPGGVQQRPKSAPLSRKLQHHESGKQQKGNSRTLQRRIGGELPPKRPSIHSSYMQKRKQAI